MLHRLPPSGCCSISSPSCDVLRLIHHWGQKKLVLSFCKQTYVSFQNKLFKKCMSHDFTTFDCNAIHFIFCHQNWETPNTSPPKLDVVWLGPWAQPKFWGGMAGGELIIDHHLVLRRFIFPSPHPSNLLSNFSWAYRYYVENTGEMLLVRY